MKNLLNPRLPRGIRLFNPCNIRKGSARFRGEKYISEDKAFCQFIGMDWGIRAALLLLMKSYYGLHHLRTVRKIISRWAPPSENNTESYVRKMCKALSVGPDEEIESTAEFWIVFLDTMILIENGRKIDRDVIKRVVETYYPIFSK